VTALARCWSITRTDGVGFFFTDLDADLVIDGNTHKSSIGFRSSAIANNAGLDVDNLEVDGFFDDDSLTEEELRAGLFDYAEVRVFLVNWQDLSQGVLKLRRGWLGEVIFTQHGFFKAELRGMTQALQQQIGDLYAAQCRADLGDEHCMVPLDPDIWEALTAYEEGDFIKYPVAVFGDYRQYANVIFECTTAGVTLGSAPAFDTTYGNTTVEGGSMATATLTFIGQPADNAFFSIQGRTYTFQNTLTNSNGHVHKGAVLADTILNACNAINLGAGSGTDYAAATTANLQISATCDATHLYVTALINGVLANSYVLNENDGNTLWGTPTMTGGLDGITWTARTSFTRTGSIDVVTDRENFTVLLDDARGNGAGFFDGGVLRFIDGPNAGKGIEVKAWTGDGSSGTVQMYLPFGYLPSSGELFTLYPGCDKTVAQCRDKFDNIINMRAEPYLPGQDKALLYPNAKA
jgi:hypothetical protein